MHRLLNQVAREVARGGAPCASEWDCSLAGGCDEATHTCVCDAWTTGQACDELFLARAAPVNGLHVDGYHSWGGHVVALPASSASDDVVYHGFFSFILGGCTLASWKSNSAIMHAVASSPSGPFRPNPAVSSLDPAVGGIVVAPWAHSAFIVNEKKDATGLWLLWHIGNASVPQKEWENCTNTVADAFPMHPQHTCNPKPCGATFYVQTSSSIDGPWSAPQRLLLTQRALNASWWSAAMKRNNPSMPAPLILPNGTTLVYYQAANCPDGWGNLAPACVGVLRSESGWRGPYDLVDGIANAPIVRHMESEDPFVFQTKRGFHLLTNINTYHKRCAAGVKCGGHAWSNDGLVWSNQTIGAFGPKVILENGSIVVNSYVERPQVFLDPTGEPEVLYVGLTRPDGYQDSVTWAQRFCGNGGKEEGCYGPL